MKRTPLFTYLARRNEMSRGAAEGVDELRTIGVGSSGMSRLDTVFAWAAVAILAAVIAFILGATFIS